MGNVGGKSFMRMIFEVTAQSVEQKEESIKKMVTDYKSGRGGLSDSQSRVSEAYGGKPTKESGGGKDAMSTSQSLELQFEMGQYTQMATGASNMMKAIKDLLSAIMRNVG